MTMLKDPVYEVPRLPCHRPARPHLAVQDHHRAADLDEHRPARRQPVADRADGRRAKSCASSKTLVQIGVKEIEVGFPSASQTDFDFVRMLIEDGHIPDDVTINVLTQAREDLIAAPSNPARRQARHRPPVQLDGAGVPPHRVRHGQATGSRHIAVNGAQLVVKIRSPQHPETDGRFEYSPESFSATELDFAKEVCDAVIDVWQPTPAEQDDRQPAVHRRNAPRRTSTPTRSNGCRRNLHRRDSVIISVHPHNDRGTGVAAAELAVMAGADRVEGCLFGNGERTGNVDLVTLALNLYTQGVQPGPGLLRHRRRAPGGRGMQPDCRCIRAIRMSATWCSPRSPARTRTRSRRASPQQQAGRALGSAVPADRPGRPRPQLRRRHPRQQPVRQGRHRLPARTGIRPRAAAPPADRIQPGGAGARPIAWAWR